MFVCAVQVQYHETENEQPAENVRQVGPITRTSLESQTDTADLEHSNVPWQY